MKLLKLAFRLSLFANIVLVSWALSQRTLIQRLLSGEKETNISLDHAIHDLKNIKQKLNDEDLRMVAKIDQLDAFLEERGIYVDKQ